MTLWCSSVEQAKDTGEPLKLYERVLLGEPSGFMPQVTGAVFV